MIPKLCSYTASERTKWHIDVYDHVSYLLGFEFHRCAYCGGCVIAAGSDDEVAVLGTCEDCGFWRIVEVQGAGGFKHGVEVPAVTSVVREFSVASLEAPIQDLRAFLRKRPESMMDMHPRVFELLIRDCLRSVYPGCEVIHVGATGDGGVDLKIVQTGEDPILVQVKRRTRANASEGVDVVRTLNGVLFREGVPTGMVVTSAERFTKAAMSEAHVKWPEANEYRMDLHPRYDIISWLNLPAPDPYQPWRTAAPERRFDRTLFRSLGKTGFFEF